VSLWPPSSGVELERPFSALCKMARFCLGMRFVQHEIPSNFEKPHGYSMKFRGKKILIFLLTKQGGGGID
jgi:hypothetical protein